MGTPTASSTPEQWSVELKALLNGPAATPPAGVAPNFENPPNLDAVIYATKAIALTLTSLAVFIRIYTRHFLLRSMGYDDYTSVLSWMGLIAYLVLSLLATRAGAGVHMWDMKLSSFFGLLYWVNVVIIVYDPVNIFVKLSILLQYSRIFNPSGRKNLPMFIAIRSCIWSIFVFYVVSMFFNIFQCNPRQEIWNKLETTGYCYNTNAIDKASGVFNVITDFAILILPMYSIWKLQMSLRNKILITCVFAIGFLACLMSIMRTYYTWQIARSPDKSYFFAAFGLWSDAEFAVGIIIGCFPVMPKFFQHVGPKVSEVFSFRSRSTSTSGNDPRNRSKTLNTDVVAKTINPFAKYRTGSSTFEFSNDPYAQLHGEYYTLDGLERPQSQATLVAGPGVATRRDDLEYGHPGPEVVRTRMM